MIKKYLLGFIVGFVGIVGFSFGCEIGEECDVSNSLPGSFYMGSINNIIGKDLNLSNSNGGNWRYNTEYSCKRSIFWNNGKLYFYAYCPSDGFYQGFFSKACKIYSSGGGLSAIDCVEGDYTEANLNEFYSLTGYNFTRYFHGDFNWVYGNQICFYNSNNHYYYCFSRQNLDNSLGIVAGEIDYSQYAGVSPFSVGYVPDIGNGGIELGSVYSAVRYYENTYGRNESICYAGIDNLSALYGSNGVSFNAGGGLNIFQVFSGLYQGDQDLTHMYVWLNTWLFNYENWFNSFGRSDGVGNPSWLGLYNSGTYQMDIYYDNLTFPFLNNPVALYFLASNIVENSPYSTMGSSVISYCNLKINSGSFEDIIDSADKNNINNYTEQYNKASGLNPDGSPIEHDGYFGSGVGIAFSGDTSITNTLKNFFEEFDKGLGVLDVNTNNRILPTWIVSAFIFVVLFKFLRKK